MFSPGRKVLGFLHEPTISRKEGEFSATVPRFAEKTL